MKWAHTRLRCKLRKFERLIFIRVKEATHTLHQLNLRIQDASTLRLAAQTRAKPGLLRRCGQLEELDALAVRAT
jgi:hypothetical protein